MKTKRRSKSSRYRGTHTHSRGFKKKARGSGHRGGFGMSGTGKRGDQKKTLILNLYGNDYFGSSKTLRRGVKPEKLKVINLQQISNNLSSLIDSKTNQVNLVGYKILGEGELKIKVKISASAASFSAIEKVKKIGGEIVLPTEKAEEEPVKAEKKPKAKKEEKKAEIKTETKEKVK